MNLAVIMPSRGIMASRMQEAVSRETRGLKWTPYWTHDLPLPACFNEPVERALADGCTHFWFVEEDVVPPAGAVKLMLGMGTDLAAIDYPLRWQQAPNGSYPGSCYMFKGKVAWCGLGCTLVAKRVFEKMEQPWFRTDWVLVAVHSGSEGEWFLRLDKQPSHTFNYGGQDSVFCHRAIELGFTLDSVKGVRAEHLMNWLPKKETA